MKTRTLLLLALACGVAIMLAGAVFLVQLSNQEDAEPPVELGVAAVAGDMSVTVDDAVEGDGVFDVTVRIGGVDDPDGASGFRLLAAGEPLTPADPGDMAGEGTVPEQCGATTVAERTCVVRFDIGGRAASARVLFYERGDVILRWVLR